LARIFYDLVTEQDDFSRMGKMKEIVLSGFIAILLSGVGSSCTTEDQLYSPTGAQVKATFSLESPSALNGKISIREVYMKLDRVQVTGYHQGDMNTDIHHPIPPDDRPFQLSKADSSQINFTLPFRTYDQLDFHLFLFQDTYTLAYDVTPTEQGPPVEEEGESPDTGDASDDNKGNSDENDSDDDTGDDSETDDGDSGEEGSDDGEGDNEEDGETEDSDDGDDNDKDKGDKDDKGKDNDKKDKKKKKDKDNDGDDNEDDDDDEDEDDGDDDRRSNGNEDRQVLNLEHFFQNAKPGMVITGTYENDARIVTIIFVAAGIEKFTVRAKQHDSFNLMLNDKNEATITFDPEIWFEGLQPADIESAQIQRYQQQEILFIHSDFNSDLYQVLASRLEESADMNFDDGNP